MSLLKIDTQLLVGDRTGDSFGRALSISKDGSIIAIAASANDGINNNISGAGQLKVFKLNTNTNLYQLLGQPFYGSQASDNLGYGKISLSADGYTLAFGLYGRNSSIGTSQVYQYNISQNKWNQIGSDINGNTTTENCGWVVSLNDAGDIVAVASRYMTYGSLTNVGRVRVFKNNNNLWQQIGNDLSGNAAGDYFGFDVNLNGLGDILAVGAPKPTGIGYVKIYKNSSGIWNNYATFNGLSSATNFGRFISLSSDGMTIAISSIVEDVSGVINVGTVRFYNYKNSSWSQIGGTLVGETTQDQFGFNISLNSSGSKVVVGSPNNNNLAGAAYIYEYKNNTWNLKKKYSGNNANDTYGYSNKINNNGNTIISGAPGTSTTNGYVEVYKLSKTKTKLSGFLSRF